MSSDEERWRDIQGRNITSLMNGLCFEDFKLMLPERCELYENKIRWDIFRRAKEEIKQTITTNLDTTEDDGLDELWFRLEEILELERYAEYLESGSKEPYEFAELINLVTYTKGNRAHRSQSTSWNFRVFTEIDTINAILNDRPRPPDNVTDKSGCCRKLCKCFTSTPASNTNNTNLESTIPGRPRSPATATANRLPGPINTTGNQGEPSPEASPECRQPGELSPMPSPRVDSYRKLSRTKSAPSIRQMEEQWKLCGTSPNQKGIERANTLAPQQIPVTEEMVASMHTIENDDD